MVRKGDWMTLLFIGANTFSFSAKTLLGDLQLKFHMGRYCVQYYGLGISYVSKYVS